jgi:uncharacterized protein (DUF1697 family)
MPRYVALLRAINVGGHTVEMKRLQRLFEELGFADVSTFIASGNVIFDVARGTVAALEARIEAHLEKSLGYEVATFLRTPAELGAVVARRAFAKPLPGATTYVGFLAAKATAPAVRAVISLAGGGNEFALYDRELHWRSTLGMGRNPLSGAKLEKALGRPMTLRKISTVEKLATKYG